MADSSHNGLKSEINTAARATDPEQMSNTGDAFIDLPKPTPNLVSALTLSIQKSEISAIWVSWPILANQRC